MRNANCDTTRGRSIEARAWPVDESVRRSRCVFGGVLVVGMMGMIAGCDRIDDARRVRRLEQTLRVSVDREAREVAQLTLNEEADRALAMTDGFAIRCLEANRSDLTPAAFARFLAERGAGLVGLNVSVSLLPDDRAATFAALPQLEWLALWGDGDLGDLSSLASPRLRSLSLGGGSASPPIDLSFLNQLPRLQELAIYGPVRRLERVASCPRLQQLSFRSGEATLTAMEAIASLPALRRLHFFDDGPIEASLLAPLSGAGELRHLNLWGVPVGDEVLPLVARCSQLEELVLDGTDITSLEPLRDLLHLRLLFVRGTEIDVDDIRDLAGNETLVDLLADRALLQELGDPKELFPAWEGSYGYGDDVLHPDFMWHDLLRLRKDG